MENERCSKPNILILLSTYNGDKYLPEQLRSLQMQEAVDVSILIRDDASTDNTRVFLESYCREHLNTKYYTGENKKPAQSFLDLIDKSGDFDFYALCDQDDVWDSDKLITGIKELKKLDNSRPNMYYSNLRIVDQDLQYIRESHSIPQVQKNKYCCLIEPMPTGCTMVFNRTTRDLIRGRIPEYCSMHDSWIYLVCQMFGASVYDFNAHISYRQHSANVIGAYNGGVKKLVERIKRLFDRNLQPRYKNAIYFLKCYDDILEGKDREKVLEVAGYKDSIVKRIRFLFDDELRALTFSRDLRNRLLIIFGLI